MARRQRRDTMKTTRNMSEGMRRRIGVRLFAVALTLVLADCAQSVIDTSSIEAFEKSLAECKRSLSPGESTQVANAVFLIAEKWLAFPSNDLSSLLDHAQRLSHYQFVQDFDQAWTTQDVLAGQAPKPTASNIMNRVNSLHLDIDKPVSFILEPLLTESEQGLRLRIGKEDEIVTLSDFRDTFGNVNSGCAFDVKNETKWPITAITVSYGSLGTAAVNRASHKLSSPLAPGDTTSLVLVMGACEQGSIDLDLVEVVGRAPFHPISRSDWLRAKTQLEKLSNAKASITDNLGQTLHWLQGLH